MINKFICALVVFVQAHAVLAEETVSLYSLLNKAYRANVSIKAFENKVEAEQSLVISKFTLDDPMIGVSTLNRGNETKYGTVSQKIRFPVKYYLQGQAQKSKVQAVKSDYINIKNEVRKSVASTYYSIFSIQKVIQLTEANMQAVRDFSRVAERKYAAGKSSQGDSMKAHVELTRLELDLLRYKQQESALQARLASIMSDPNFKRLDFKGVELKAPTFKSDALNTSLASVTQLLKDKSPKLKKQSYLLAEAETKSNLAKWGFAPDIQLQYQQRISGLPEKSKIFSVALSIPMWFWKKGAESSAASSLELAQSYRLQNQTNLLLAKVNDLKGRVSVGEKTLKIYTTSLIPQALGAYNSSKASYRASKTSFLYLLDSERSLFRVRTGYYHALKDYVSNLLELESELGFVVSDLDQGDLK